MAEKVTYSFIPIGEVEQVEDFTGMMVAGEKDGRLVKADLNAIQEVLNAARDAAASAAERAALVWQQHGSEETQVEAKAGEVHTWTEQMGAVEVLLQVPADGQPGVYTLLIPFGEEASLTIVNADENIVYPDGWAVEPNRLNEISVLYAGWTFYLRGGTYTNI